MIYSLLIVAGVATALYWYKRWQKAPEEKRSQIGRQYLIWAAAGVVLALVVTGRAHWLMGVLAALLAVAGRVAQFAQFIPLFKKILGGAQTGEPRAGQGSNHQAPSQQTMSRQEAADILGIDVNATEEEIRLAHKKLMQKIHPDRGGSDALAKQINNAKDILLN